jgi:hypothetical protein
MKRSGLRRVKGEIKMLKRINLNSRDMSPDKPLEELSQMKTRRVKMTLKLDKTTWIGAKGRAFERVQLAFEVARFEPPQPVGPGQTGTYVANIIDQYRTDLTENQVLAIIYFGMTNTIELLKWEKNNPARTLADMELAYNSAIGK